MGKLTSLRNLTLYIAGIERGFLLAELGPLKLKGYLHLKHLQRIKSVMDAKEANMSSKQLNELWLSWSRYRESEIQENVEEILEVLQPDTQRLHTLKVIRYKGAHFPQWMSSPSLKFLTDLELMVCESCLKLPALGKLPSLKKLWIYEMKNVKYVYEECYDGGVVFMALEYLTLMKLPSLIRLSREDGENMFPHLSKLHIFECPEFSAGLHEALQHMTALKSLSIGVLPNLESLPDCFGNLPLLRYLAIESCSKLRCLPTSLSLSNLKSLTIHNCCGLEKRCEKETGEDWLKIAHIPHINVTPAI